MYPGRAWEGPVVYHHEPLGTGSCAACGFRGVPLEFASEEEWRDFQEERLRNYWTGPEPASDPRRATRAWVVCGGCLSPWVEGGTEAPTTVHCRACGAIGRPSNYPDLPSWAAGLRARHLATAPAPAPAPDEEGSYVR